MNKSTQQTPLYSYTFKHEETGDTQTVDALGYDNAWCALCARLGVIDELWKLVGSNDILQMLK